MSFCVGSPGGWTRPLSRIAMRSWTQSKGLAVSTCASRNPAQPASCGCAVNSSDKVGLGGAGSRQRSPNPLGRRYASAARLPPPATRDKPLATRLTTLLFYFCSYPATRGQESMARLRRDAADDRRTSFDFCKEPFNLGRDLAQCRPPQGK